MTPHFDAAGNARAYLNDEGIEFAELANDSNVTAKRNFNAPDAPGTPLVYTGYRRIDGFNRKKLDQALLACQH